MTKPTGKRSSGNQRGKNRQASNSNGKQQQNAVIRVQGVKAGGSKQISKVDKKSSKGLLADVVSLSKSKQHLPKTLVRILNTLKNEYKDVDNTKYVSPSIKSISNPVILLNNKPLGPAKKNVKPDGVVNLDDILQTRKNVKENSKSIGERFISDTSYAKKRIEDIKSKLDDILKKRSVLSPVVTTPPKVSSHTITTIKPTKARTSQPKAVVMNTQSTHQPIKDDVQLLREKVDLAIRHNKLFTVNGNYYSIRNALLSRGWVEKMHPTFIPHNTDANLVRRLQFLTIPELSLGIRDKQAGHLYRQIMCSKMVGTHPVAFYWDLNRETFRHNLDAFKNTTINFISKNRFNYANKYGLCESSKQAYWFNNPGVSYLSTPRSYSLSASKEPDEFVHDFKVTAAASFLKWIISTYESKQARLISKAGKIAVAQFHFALEECAKFVKQLRHEDIDKEIPAAEEQRWVEFLDCFYKCVHVGNHFKETNLESELSLLHKAKVMVRKLAELWPYVDLDGYMNIWLLKPSFGSRGIGIHFCRTMQYVLKVVREHKTSSYVVQKYIERPLLIHDTKFDIRQWFLISSTLPLTIWIYKECYLRFSSQTYNLRKLHESIHLTNNSVQSKYHNGHRDPCLPLHNMWFLKQFKEHLANNGYPTVFKDIIYPGMKECITAAILANQEQLYKSPKTFELHGADFMITEDFKPWLIEINSRPALNPSTPVTSKLCPAVLEDVIKVVIDHARNPRSSTGNFELLFKENIYPLPGTDPNTLKVEGKPLNTAKYFLTNEQEKEMERMRAINTCSTDSINIVKTTDYIKYVSKEMKETLKELLQVIEKEKERRQKTSLTESNKKVEELNSVVYCDDMERLKSNMKQIHNIFNNDLVMKAQSGVSVAAPMSSMRMHLSKTTPFALHKNSSKIKEAIECLDDDTEENVKKAYSSIINIMDNMGMEQMKT